MRSRYSSRRQMMCALVAYAIALQALLTAWAGALQPAQAGFDPLSVICRTVTSDEDGKQPPAGAPADHGLVCHYTACTSAPCCAGGPAAAAIVIPVPKLAEAAILPDQERSAARASWLLRDHSARGPPVAG